MNFITQLKDRPNKNKVYPITLEKAVYDDDGNRLDTKVAQLRADVDELLYKDLTLSLVLEGAMNDTITIYDNADTQVAVCAFNNATTGIVTLTIPKAKIGTEYRFVSSVAKDFDGNDFSKSVIINENITNVKVMPDGYVYYWYGYDNTGALRTDYYATYNVAGIFSSEKMPSKDYTKYVQHSHGTVSPQGINVNFNEGIDGGQSLLIKSFTANTQFSNFMFDYSITFDSVLHLNGRPYTEANTRFQKNTNNINMYFKNGSYAATDVYFDAIYLTN